MLQRPVIGATYFIRGLRLLTRPGLKRYVAVPLAVNVLVFGLLLWLAIGQFDALLAYLTPDLPAWLPGWLIDAVAALVWLLFGVAAAVVVFFSFSILANLIAAPFNGLLAEAVERHLTGRLARSDDGGWRTALREAPGALLDELRKLAYFARWALPFLLLFLIPGVNLLAPFAWLLFSAWMLAAEYTDYPMGNHGLKALEQRKRLQGNRLLTYGFGGVTLAATLVPVLNFFVMPAAVAGATALWVERLQTAEAGKN
jgi:CysZ protein